MSKPKILIFAPREEPPETIEALQGLGCEVVFGNRDWQLPRRSDEEAEAIADDLDWDARDRRPAGKRDEARVVGLLGGGGQELGLGRVDQLDLPLHQPARAHQPGVVDGGDPLPIGVRDVLGHDRVGDVGQGDRAVGAESHTKYRALMVERRPDRPTRARLPQTRCFIAAPRQNGFTVGA